MNIELTQISGDNEYLKLEGTITAPVGISRRDYFAAMAMQGHMASLSNHDAARELMRAAHAMGVDAQQMVAIHALRQADALIALLDAKP